MKVSICMITNNHENYIREAIEGILNKDVSFNLELVKANDKSTDNTHSIIEEIITTNPKGDLIKYYKTNLGVNPNSIFTLQQCKGAYVS